MTVAELLEQAKELSSDERKELARLILDTVDKAEAPRKKHSILELAGLGKEIWEGIDAQEYINALRSEWDHRE
jgi:hypothetical protein